MDSRALGVLVGTLQVLVTCTWFEIRHSGDGKRILLVDLVSWFSRLLNS